MKHSDVDVERRWYGGTQLRGVLKSRRRCRINAEPLKATWNCWELTSVEKDKKKKFLKRCGRTIGWICTPLKTWTDLAVVMYAKILRNKLHSTMQTARITLIGTADKHSAYIKQRKWLLEGFPSYCPLSNFLNCLWSLFKYEILSNTLVCALFVYYSVHMSIFVPSNRWQHRVCQGARQRTSTTCLKLKHSLHTHLY